MFEMSAANLLFIVTKLELGGAQSQLLGLVEDLAKKKEFNLYLFTCWEGFLLPEFLKIKGLTLKKSRYLERRINPWKDLCALVEICRFIKQNNIRLVHTHSSKAGILGRLAARLAGGKCIIIHTVHGWPFHEYQPWLVRRLYTCLEKQAARFSNKLIVVCRSDEEKGLRNSVGKRPQYQLIRYGIDRDIFYHSCGEEKIRDEFAIGPQNLLVTNISCFKPQKSPLDFVRVAEIVLKELPQARFLLVGDGILRRKIEKQIRRLKLQEKIILVGWRRDIAQLLSASDCLALTSLWEGLPIVALEAMSCGCPVVATDTGGIREVIAQGRNGFLAPPKDTFALAQKLIVLLKDARLRKSMGELSRISLKDDFCLSESCRHHYELYKNLLHAYN